MNDNLVEQDEYFIVQLSGGNEAIDVLTNTAQVTITDDDGMWLSLYELYDKPAMVSVSPYSYYYLYLSQVMALFAYKIITIISFVPLHTYT